MGKQQRACRHSVQLRQQALVTAEAAQSAMTGGVDRLS
jgi:hypothetical protein